MLEGVVEEGIQRNRWLRGREHRMLSMGNTEIQGQVTSFERGACLFDVRVA